MELFTQEELDRYSRHLVLPEVGRGGQEKLKRGSVLIVGVGGLGSPAAFYLAAAGVGTIGIVDAESVDASNLQRQILFNTRDVGRAKAELARERMLALNPYITVRSFSTRLTSVNALQILKDYRVVIDCSDNFPTRYLLNDACVLLGKPLVHGSVYRFEGQAAVFAAGGAPCYRCLYPVPPDPKLASNCAEGGVLGVLPGVVGTIQATEALNLLLGTGEPLIGRLLLFDALTMRFEEVRFDRNVDCALCGKHPSIHELIDYETFCGMNEQAAHRGSSSNQEISVEELKERLDRGDDLMLVDVRQPNEHAFANIGGVLIPMNELPERMGELKSAKEIVVYCRSGSRSRNATRFLLQQGFANVLNLTGGILAWADRIDPKIPKY
jgi:molybdopterin/thiamine biosynthesis adenylyltransferase/rhodanese-related sulfurtransferase